MLNESGLLIRALRAIALSVAALLCGASGVAQSEAGKISSIEANTDRWIELQSRIAESKNSWKNDRLLLESSIGILEAEQATLQQGIAANEKASQVYIANRDSIKKRVEEQRESLHALKQPLAKVEAELRALLPRLPPPLHAEVKAHLAKLDAVGSPITSRAQSLVASLTAIDRFSNSLTSRRVVRPGPNGGEVSVRVLYWGLAVAYGVDEANGRAWVIRPSAGDWVWQQRDEIFEAALELINGYEKESEDPQLIELPTTLS